MCAVDVFSKYAWAFPLKDKKREMITKATQKVLDVSGRKPNKVCVDKESKFYQKLTKFW